MTGFSVVTGDYRGFSWNWEIKSLNSKGLDVRCRLPGGLENLEVEVRKLLGARLARGSVNASLSIKDNQKKTSVKVNTELLRELVVSTKEALEDIEDVGGTNIESLLGVKGVIEVTEEDVAEKNILGRNSAILEDFGKALEELLIARRLEGSRLLTKLKDQLQEMKLLVIDAKKVDAIQPEVVRERLTRHVDELLSINNEIPEDRLSQELAFLLIKSDVCEELDRIDSHFQSVAQLLKDGGVVGRKLDFLCQEINREVNTIGSKSSSFELSNIGLELKSVIDKFREQVQNIE
ncbi:MAG: YicC/YloC family endoribonuclease [Pseudomonadota bacterium]|nr:YicC/YloC family endoribonuclease [Pseudomonadota bacterium]